MREGKLPLRTVLQNFINHTDHHIDGEFHENEFQELKKFTEDLKGNQDYSSTEGERDCNRRKNRYKDILPYDYTRVTLQDIPGVPGSDYVNANYIRGASGSRAYIASQGPLPHTVGEFWRMVVECDVQVIVMASNETEGGKHKCECYWVSAQGEQKQFGNVQVTYIKSREVCPDFLVRTFKIKYSTDKNKKEERVICQFHYILWPDHGIPDTVRPLLDMVRLVRDCQASETLPVLVHCSAGCGRTGTICAIDYVWGLLRTGKLSQNLDLFGLVKEMRRQRVAMVQTREQYVLLHQAVKELFKDRLKLIDAHPYENISTDGNPLAPTEKESDYEELFISSEKHDKSTKVNEASSSNSLNKNQITRSARDSIRKSVSTSSLDSCIMVGTCTPEKLNHFGPSVSSQNMHQSMPYEATTSNGDSTFPTPTSVAYAQIVGSHHAENGNADRKKYAKPSKMEKDAENFAQLAKEKVMLGQQPKAVARLPAMTYQADTRLPFVLGDLPLPPRRSRTPSPGTTSRSTKPGSDVGRNSREGVAAGQGQSKDSIESSKKANIQKLKEVFETSLAGGVRSAKLTRSASSVSIRPNFSVAGSDRDRPEDGRAKSFSSEGPKTAAAAKNLPICPPPPPTDPIIPEHWKMKRSLTALSLVTSKHSPEFHLSAAASSSRRGDRLARGADERPLLPVKKSKSFRWSRQDHVAAVPTRSLATFCRPSRLPSNKSEHDLNPDVPAGKERFKLSVYQGTSDVSSSSSGSASDIHSLADSKPVVPPKKTIGERYKSFKTQLQSGNGAGNPVASAAGIIPVDQHAFGKSNAAILREPKGTQASVGTQMYPNELPLKPKQPRTENVVDRRAGDKGKRAGKNSINSYVNAKALKGVGDEGHYSYVPLPSKRTAGRSVGHYVNYSASGFDPTTTTKVGNASQKSDPRSTAPRKNAVVTAPPTGGGSGNPSTIEYEPVDFGEGCNLSGDVFETVNYELVNPQSIPAAATADRKDFYLNRDLDTIAKQVYKDCEAYLLSRDNRSPVPSLLPKQQPPLAELKPRKEPKKPIESVTSTDLEHVINKIAVPPQGLRNRERRNSYRQAVSATGVKSADGRRAQNIHKYERIWFETDDPKLPVNRNRSLQDPATGRTVTVGEYSPNVNKDTNISAKDSLFKDKLEEIHLMMNDIERKHLQYLPDLSEEELSSKHSSSTSSLLSRSEQSSRSSERAEPVYVNTCAVPKPSGYLTADESNLGPFNTMRKPRPEPDSRRAASQYGTLATTTSYPYRQTRAPQYGLPSTAGPGAKPCGNPYTATLPLRSVISPPDTNVLYTPSIYRKPTLTALASGDPKTNPGHHPLQVYQHMPKAGKMAAAITADGMPPKLHHKMPVGNKPDSFKRVEQPISSSCVRKRLQSSYTMQLPSAPPRLKRNSLLDETLESFLYLNSAKPSEVHRKRQELNAKGSIFKPSDFPLLPSRNPLQQSRSTPHFDPQAAPQKRGKSPPRTSPGTSSGKVATGFDQAASRKKKNYKDLNCVSSTALSDSSPEDSSPDDDGVFVKFAPANILKKFRTAQAQGGSSKFYKEDSPDPADHQQLTADTATLSPPPSPKTFTKAFGKFKIGSKNVALNFKSYIKGDKVPDEDLPKSENCSSSSLQSFEELKDYKYPLHLPKKPKGPRDMPSTFVTNPASFSKKSKQQYL